MRGCVGEAVLAMMGWMVGQKEMSHQSRFGKSTHTFCGSEAE